MGQDKVQSHYADSVPLAEAHFGRKGILGGVSYQRNYNGNDENDAAESVAIEANKQESTISKEQTEFALMREKLLKVRLHNIVEESKISQSVGSQVVLHNRAIISELGSDSVLFEQATDPGPNSYQSYVPYKSQKLNLSERKQTGYLTLEQVSWAHTLLSSSKSAFISRDAGCPQYCQRYLASCKPS